MPEVSLALEGSVWTEEEAMVVASHTSWKALAGKNLP